MLWGLKRAMSGYLVQFVWLESEICLNQADEETSYNEYVPLALHLSDEYFINNASRFSYSRVPEH